ncbi:MAG: Stp1/IreP family PP2C-type Ser/Thr phosphatase [Candidatus Sumerlaeaceae bacterium]|nr:Stp1/IreP family PP2C-type Ser/Thr phosphatase [Candidatus Sumerlaeaceae bacterium]
MKLTSFGITDVGLRRSHNEDNFYRSDESGLFLVADGMGGHAAGEVASGSAIQAIVEFFIRHAEDSSVTWPFGYDTRFSAAANALLNGVRLANQRLYNLQQERPELSGMGTTIAAIEVNKGVATMAHVGDSRVYRFRDDTFELLTSDHSWVNEQLQKNIITAEEARNHRYRNVITRALGNRLDLEIDVRLEDVKPGDTFLVCSDGLSGMVPDDAMGETVRSTKDLRECANKLVSMANEAGGHDNITVVLLRVEE